MHARTHTIKRAHAHSRCACPHRDDGGGEGVDDAPQRLQPACTHARTHARTLTHTHTQLPFVCVRTHKCTHATHAHTQTRARARAHARTKHTRDRRNTLERARTHTCACQQQAPPPRTHTSRPYPRPPPHPNRLRARPIRDSDMRPFGPPIRVPAAYPCPLPAPCGPPDSAPPPLPMQRAGFGDIRAALAHPSRLGASLSESFASPPPGRPESRAGRAGPSIRAVPVPPSLLGASESFGCGRRSGRSAIVPRVDPSRPAQAAAVCPGRLSRSEPAGPGASPKRRMTRKARMSRSVDTPACVRACVCGG